MCIYSMKARLAASYLQGSNLKLFLMEDVYDTDHFDIAEMGECFSFLSFKQTKRETEPVRSSSSTVLDQVKPDLVLVNAGAEDGLVDKIKARGEWIYDGWMSRKGPGWS